MERYNIFNLIHKGLRASLYHTSIQLQRTDFTSPEEVENILNRLKEIIMLFEGHAEKEDSFILPVIHQYEPSVAAGFEEEHEKDEELGILLRQGIEKMEKASTLLEKTAAARDLTAAFESFTVFNLQHMAKEETILNNILWRYYSDHEIMAINNQIVQSVAPWMQDFYATWMLRGINDTETSQWLKSVKNQAPPVILRTLLQKAENEFSAQRFRKITRSLGEELIPA